MPYSSAVNRMRKTLIAVLGLVLASFDIQLAKAESTNQTSERETWFCEYDRPGNLPLKPLPNEVLRAVMDTKEGKEAQQSATAEAKKLAPEELLEGTQVHLTASRELFFAVMGSYPLSGADNTWFWLVRKSGKSASILLFAGASCLTFSQRKTLGYADVVTTWSSAAVTVTQTYRYDGRSYKLWRTKSRRVGLR